MPDLVRATRRPEQASGRLRKAAEHYVRNGCKAIGPSLIYAGYSPRTAKDPTANGYTHDRLVQVAAYWNRGTQATARAHLATAIRSLAEMMNDPSAPHNARGAAARTIIEVSGKEEEKQDMAETSKEEQAKWMSQIRHWKRVFLRRGILLGMGGSLRAGRLLADLNYILGKGPRPEWWAEEEDGEAVQRLEGDLRPGSYLEAEVVEEESRGAVAETPGSGSDPTDPV